MIKYSFYYRKLNGILFRIDVCENFIVEFNTSTNKTEIHYSKEEYIVNEENNIKVIIESN